MKPFTIITNVTAKNKSSARAGYSSLNPIRETVIDFAFKSPQSRDMDDTLVLNLALEEGPSTRRELTKKGGRWTDRCVGDTWL